MSKLPYDRLRSIGNDLTNSDVYRVSKVIDEDDCWLASFATDSLYALLQISPAAPGLDRSLIDVHAGGAYGLSADGALFQTVATSTWRFDFGGPWARVLNDGSAAFGWRSRLPSELFHDCNLTDAFGFVLGMIDAFGNAAGALTEELIPLYGGSPMRDWDPMAWPPLLAGLLPPE